MALEFESLPLKDFLVAFYKEYADFQPENKQEFKDKLESYKQNYEQNKNQNEPAIVANALAPFFESLGIASSLYTGYSYGVAPMISFYYGEKNHEKLKKLVHISLKVIGVISIVMAAASFIFTRPMVSVFARPDNPVFNLAVTGNRICTIALLFIGYNIFASGMFTALSNGIISAVLAFSRSFVFMLITMIVLPLILGVNGIWLATPAAEVMALGLSAFMFLKYRNRYKFL